MDIYENEKGVKPIVVFAIFLCVFIFGIYLLYVISYPPRHDKSTPQYELKCYQSDKNDYIIEIQEIPKGKGRPLNFVWYILEGGSGSHSGWWRKNASRTVGTDLEFEDRNFSYIDKDNDGYTTEGDYFIIRSRENGGPAEDGMTVRMRSIITERYFDCLDLTSEKKKEFKYPSTEWEFDSLDETNISMDKNQSALSQAVISENDNQKCRLSFENSGNDSLCLKIIIRNESDIIKEQHLLLNKSTAAIVNASFQARFFNSTTMQENHSVNIQVIDENSTEVLLSVYSDYQVNRYSFPTDSFSMEPKLMIFSTFFIVWLIIKMNHAISFSRSKKTNE